MLEFSWFHIGFELTLVPLAPIFRRPSSAAVKPLSLSLNGKESNTEALSLYDKLMVHLKNLLL